MSPIWAVPFLVLLVGGVALLALLRGTAESARDLRAEIARFGELHDGVTRLRDETRLGARRLRDVRER